MDVNHLATVGFFFTNWGDVVGCTFCGVEVGHWKEGDDVFKDHQRWSPSCAFVKGLFVGNIPAPPRHLNNLAVAKTCASLISTTHENLVSRAF